MRRQGTGNHCGGGYLWWHLAAGDMCRKRQRGASWKAGHHMAEARRKGKVPWRRGRAGERPWIGFLATIFGRRFFSNVIMELRTSDRPLHIASRAILRVYDYPLCVLSRSYPFQPRDREVAGLLHPLMGIAAAFVSCKPLALLF